MAPISPWEMLFKTGKRKTSTGMTRLLQDKGPRRQRWKCGYSGLEFRKKELEKLSCRSLQGRAGEQRILPQPSAASRVWIQQPGRLEGAEMHNSCEDSTQGMETPELQAVPTSSCAPSTRESLSCDAQPLFFLSLGGKRAATEAGEGRKSILKMNFGTRGGQ